MFKQKKSEKSGRVLPVHLGIVMDGNGRWAKRRGMPRSVGHTYGANTFRTITRYCRDIGIKYLTVYAFSTENWRRPDSEVSAIMNLFRDYLKEAISDFASENVRTFFIGDRSVLDGDIRDLMEICEKGTKDKTGMTCNISINYGGRMEVIKAVKELAQGCADGSLSPDSITEADISDRLYTAGQPDPDLIIRPSGEYRTSNFLLWQSAYAEYYFTDTLWPDFKPRDINKAIEEYSKRQRRYGGV